VRGPDADLAPPCFERCDLVTTVKLVDLSTGNDVPGDILQADEATGVFVVAEPILGQDGLYVYGPNGKPLTSLKEHRWAPRSFRIVKR
jgi:hypothetical protein